ncbi:LOW QUALITY PROTEIN: hypothetical protein HID58_060890 [Brassica napus]|uniref:Uncharacterized protein n=1 Tax=Brassica napus TaxID=3708 RepID=A0ABQ7ZX12_BRANA|nr:LOW QUALITY PROTEIN: hypothetical protein HID58_060890 [Brassica napus]
MLVDILTCGLYYPAPSNLMIVSKNIVDGTELFELKSDNFNILVSRLDGLCFSISMLVIDQSAIVPNRRMKLAHTVNTDVFWNKEDCRIPEGLDPHNIYQNIKSALAKPGCRGAGLITLVSRDYNVLLTVPDETEYNLPLGQDRKSSQSKGYNIFVAHTEKAASPVLPPACLEWRLDTLLAGGRRTGGKRIIPESSGTFRTAQYLVVWILIRLLLVSWELLTRICKSRLIVARIGALDTFLWAVDITQTTSSVISAMVVIT